LPWYLTFDIYRPRLLGAANTTEGRGSTRRVWNDTAWVVRLVTICAAAVALAGCAHDERPSEEDIRKIARQADGPVYYVGMSFEGLPLTHADGPQAARPSEAAFGYGDCEPTGSEGGCPLPLDIQSAVCPGGRREVAIFTAGGFPPRRMRDVVRALRPVGGRVADRPDRIVFQVGPTCRS